MAMNAMISAARGGGDVVVSFGSGDTSGSGRLGRRVGNNSGSRVGRSNASSREVAAVRRQINNSGASARRRRAALQELQDNANRRGNIKRGVLRDILDAVLGR
jgi:hypothetical protein